MLLLLAGLGALSCGSYFEEDVIIGKTDSATGGAAGDSGSDGAPCTAAAPSPLAWWRGEDDGSEEIQSLTLTLNNTFAEGYVGRAFSFNGTDELAELSSGESLLPLGSVSTELWLQTTQTTSAAVFALYECAESCEANGSSAWTLRLTSIGGVSINVRDADAGGPGADGYQSLNSLEPVNDGSFHHVVAVRDVEHLELVLYVDGVRSAGAPLDANTRGPLSDGDSEADPFTLGGRRSSGAGGQLTDLFAGSIDELTVWGSALTDDDVAALYAAGASGKCAGQ